MGGWGLSWRAKEGDHPGAMKHDCTSGTQHTGHHTLPSHSRPTATPTAGAQRAPKLPTPCLWPPHLSSWSATLRNRSLARGILEVSVPSRATWLKASSMAERGTRTLLNHSLPLSCGGEEREGGCVVLECICCAKRQEACGAADGPNSRPPMPSCQAGPHRCQPVCPHLATPNSPRRCSPFCGPCREWSRLGMAAWSVGKGAVRL